MIKACIVGASGYSGIELVRLLSKHPSVELVAVSSRSLKGELVADHIPLLRNQLGNLQFIHSDPTTIPEVPADIFFLALPHGAAATYARTLTEKGKRVIDLSADFRLSTTECYKEFYGEDHPAPDLLNEAPYVLPEISKNSNWKKASLIACPGCYPTSTIVPLVPLLENEIISSNGIVVNSFSGVSGAGKKLSETFLFCERNESACAYGQPKHRHLSEIEEQLSSASQSEVVIQFNPHLAPMLRGIATTITVPAKSNSLENLYASWNKQYSNSPFIRILKSGSFPDTAHVRGTNYVDISAVYDERTNNFVITSAIDNLLKGASGQAVQIMNLLFDLQETEGLEP